MNRVARRAIDLPLLWKLLLPFLVMLVAVGTLGTFVLTRDQATRAQTGVDAELAQGSLQARSIARDRELYVVESGTFAANLQGMAEAVQTRDSTRVNALVRSVLALKPDLVLVAVTDTHGQALVELSRASTGGQVLEDPPADLSRLDPLRGTIAGGHSSSALSGFLGRHLLLESEPVCPASGACTPTGYTVEAVDAASLLPAAQPVAAGNGLSVALYDQHGDLVTGTGSRPPGSVAGRPDGRVLSGAGGAQAATLYTAFDLSGVRAGTLAVTLPTAPAYAAVRSATTQLLLLFLAVIVGTVLILGGITGYILRRLRLLVDTNRELAAGNLAARAAVRGEDEIGQLAGGVNRMAESLQESYATLETRVEARTADVRRLLDERTDFFTAVSHEFRTPLAVIQANADMMVSDDFAKPPEWAVRTGESIREASGQLLAFVNDILDLSRAERGGLEVEIGDVDLAGLLKAIQPGAETLASTSGVQLQMELPRRLPAVRADPTRLRQAIVNLVDNAIKYTPRGGEVTVSASAAQGSVDLVVADTGVGIPADELERIFEPFYRVRGTMPQNGRPSSGIGLALVRRIVSALGGDVRASSDTTGTRFTVTLPSVIQGPPARRRTARVAGPATRTTPGSA